MAGGQSVMPRDWPECVRPAVRKFLSQRMDRWRREDREDVEQQVMVRLLRVAPEGNMTNYALRVATNLAIDYSRSCSRRPVTVSMDNPVESAEDLNAHDVPSSEDLEGDVVAFAHFAHHYDRLPDNDKQIIAKLVEHDCNRNAIAADLGLSLSTTNARAHRARERYRAALAS